MVLVSESMFDGTGVRMYRSTSEIRRDISQIAEKIREAKDKLSIRDCIVTAVSAHENPEKLIPILKDIIGEAEQTLEELDSLKEKLSFLGEELLEVKRLVCR